MAFFSIHFTLDEANALLPWVRSVFARIHELLQDLARSVVRQRQAGLPLPATPNGNGNGHRSPRPAPQSPSESEQSRHEKIELINQMLGALMERGIVIQDVERGLIDFPAVRGGEEVLLCYELADGERIGFWHGLYDGFAGRRPIAEF